MIDQGVNPHICSCSGKTQYDRRSLSHLKNVTPLKSVHFIIKRISSDVAGDPWHSSNGIYPATFTTVIGQGGEGSVLGGELNGVEVALKFVKVGAIKPVVTVNDGFANKETKLSEMSTMNDAKGSCVLKLLGHYRLVYLTKLLKTYFFKFKPTTVL